MNCPICKIGVIRRGETHMGDFYYYYCDGLLCNYDFISTQLIFDE